MKKLHKDSRGIAHLFLILLFAGIVGVAGFAYWRVSSYNNKNDSNGREAVSPDGSSGNTGDVSDECVAQTGDENICRLGAITDLSQYSSIVRMVSNDVESVIKFDGKGNSETVIGDLRGIEVSGRYYIYMMDAWYDSGSDSSQMPKDSVPSLGFATTAGIKYENLGKEACGNDTCFKYRMSGGILGDGVVVCWFGDKDFLPRRYESTGGGLLGTMTMTIDYQPVTISAPEGAKPISSLIPGA